MATKVPAIQTPRDFVSDGGRTAKATIDAIRIRIEALESSAGVPADVLAQIEASLLARLIELFGATGGGGGDGQDPTRSRPIVTAAASVDFGAVLVQAEVGAELADINDPADAIAVIGLAAAPANAGADLPVVTDGDFIQNSSWNWSVGDILYAGENGTLSTVPGAGQWMRRIGIALDSNVVLLLMGEPIMMSSSGRFLRLAVSGRIETAEVPFNSDNFIATPDVLAAKQVLLSGAPADPMKVELILFHGIEQKPGVDFLVTGNVLSWDSLALESLLESGDTFTARYLS